MGTKLGYNCIDNGYVAFNQYRVPRISLLARLVSVSREGEFKQHGNPLLLYNIMTMTRVKLCYLCGHATLRACVISTRYSVCRR